MGWMRCSRGPLGGGADPLAEPAGQFFFAQFTCCESLEYRGDLRVRCGQRISVFAQKTFANHRCCSLVSIDEWMIFRETKSVACGELRRVRIPISGKIFRSRHRALE